MQLASIATLDISDVLAKLAALEQRFASTTRFALRISVTGTNRVRAASQEVETLTQRLQAAAAAGRISIGMGIDPALASNLARLTAALAANTTALERGRAGLTRYTNTTNLAVRSGVAFGTLLGSLPGPLGIVAVNASLLASALTGLSAAQQLNTLAAFALVGGLAAVGAATATLASQGVEQLKSYQKALNILRLDDTTNIADVEDQLRRVQQEGGRVAQTFSRSELAGAIADLTKQNLTNAQSLKLVQSSLKLAAAEGENLQDVSKLLLTNLRQFGLDGDAAAATAEKFTDVLSKGSLLAAGNATDLSKALSVVGPVGKAAGFSLEELTGYLVALDNAGLKASTIGANALRAVLLAILSPSGEAARNIEKLGVKLRDANGHARNGRDVLLDLRRAVGNTAESYDEATLAQLKTADSVTNVASIFRSRGVVGFLNLTAAADGYTRELQNALGAGDRYANTLTQGVEPAQKRLKASFDDLALSFAETFGPKLEQVLDGLKRYVDSAEAIVNGPALGPYMASAAVGAGALATALFLVSDAGKAVLAVTSFRGFLTLLGGTVAGGIFSKAAAGLRAIGAAGTFAFQVGGIRAVLGFLATFTVSAGVAAAAVGGIALALGGLTAFYLKTIGDIQAINASIDSSTAKVSNQIMGRAKELLAAGGEVNRVRAQLLLAIDRQGDASLRGDGKAYELETERIRDLKRELASLTTFEGAVASASDATTKVVEKQSAAYGELSDKLVELNADLQRVDGTAFEKALDSAADKVQRFREQVNQALAKREISANEAARLNDRADAVLGRAQEAALREQLDRDRQARLDNEREIQRGKTALIQDEVARRNAELDGEIQAIRDEYGPKIREAFQNASAAPTPQGRRAFQNAGGQLQVQQQQEIDNARRATALDLEKIEARRADAVRQASARILQSQASEAEARVKTLEGQRDREVALYAEGSEARVRVEERYAPLLLKAREASILAASRAERRTIEGDLAERLRDAKEAGSRRGELELAAREDYATRIRTLDINTEAQLADARVKVTENLNRAKADLYRADLDAFLKTLEQQSGAELAATQRRLQARRAEAVASGNTALVGVIDDALVQVTSQIKQNAQDFKDQLKESGKEATNLREQLAGISREGLAKARSEAAAPFNVIIQGATKEVEALQKAFDKLTPAEKVGAQGAALKRALAVQNGIILDTNLERNAALLRTDQAFERTRQDKAAENAAKLAKKQYDASDGQLEAQYVAALIADRRYWEGRLKNAKSAEDIDAIEQKLADNDSERARVREDRERRAREAEQKAADQRARTRADLARAVEGADTEGGRETARARQIDSDLGRLAEVNNALNRAKLTDQQRNDLLDEQIQLRADLARYGDEDRARAEAALDGERAILAANVENARSDEARTIARQQLLAFDRQRLANAEAELAAANMTGATQEERLEIEGRVLALRGSIRSAEEDELQRAESLLASRLKLAGAEQDYADLIAKTDAEVQQGLFERLALNARELADIDRRIEAAKQRGEGEEALNALLEERLQAEGQGYQIAAQLARLPLEVAEQQQDVLTSEIALRAQLLGLADDALTTSQNDLADTQAKLRLVERRLALEGEGALTDEERRAAQVELNRLLADENEARRNISAALRQQVVAARELAEAQEALGRALGGQDGAGSTAAAELGNIRRQMSENSLALQDQNLTEGERNKLVLERVNLTTREIEASRRLFDANRDRLKAEQALTAERRKNALNASADRDNPVKIAENDLRDVRERLRLAQEDFRLAGTDTRRDEAEKRIVAATSEETAAVQKLATAYTETAQRSFDLLTARVRAAAQISGIADDAVLSAQLEYDLARQQVSVLQARLDASRQLGLSAREQEDIQNQIVTALGAQYDAERKVTEAERERVKLRESLDDSITNFGRAADQQSTNPTVFAEQALEDATFKRQRALRDLQLAQADFEKQPVGGNAERLKTALDGATSAITGQREALRNLAESYRALLSTQDAVRDGTEKLRNVLNPKKEGEDAKVKDPNLEYQRLDAIKQRRDKALADLNKALDSGDVNAVKDAQDKLTAAQERFQKQAEVLKKAGLQFSPDNTQPLEQALDRLDKFNLENDFGANGLEGAADDLEQKSKATDTEMSAVQKFENAVQELDFTFVSRSALLNATLTSALDAGAQKLREALRSFKVPELKTEEKKDAGPQAPEVYSGVPTSYRPTSVITAQAIQDALNGFVPQGTINGAVAGLVGTDDGENITQNLTFAPVLTFNLETKPGQEVDVRDLADQVMDVLDQQRRDFGCAPDRI